MLFLQKRSFQHLSRSECASAFSRVVLDIPPRRDERQTAHDFRFNDTPLNDSQKKEATPADRALAESHPFSRIRSNFRVTKYLILYRDGHGLGIVWERQNSKLRVLRSERTSDQVAAKSSGKGHFAKNHGNFITKFPLVSIAL